MSDGASDAALVPAGEALLEVDALRGGYGDTVVLRGLSARLAAGEVLGVLGRNGVGKTTLMRLLMGYLAPFGGQIRLRGHDLARLAPHRRRRLGIAYAPQEGVVFDALSVRDNLTLHRTRRELDAYESLFDSFPRVRERLGQAAGRLSGGEKKLVTVVRAIGERAPLTLLDEPSEGVQQENIERMAAWIGRRRGEGGAFVIVEQNLALLLSVMQQVLVLDHGEVVRAARAEAVDRDELERHLRV
jgi:ABC-type branched-subunit amino acid transport system ATPase component